MKRLVVLCSLVVGMVATTAAARLWAAKEPAPQKLVRRYAIQVDLKRYPQADPRQAIGSVIAATRAREIEYLLAHLISPAQVDKKLGGDRRALVKLAAKATAAKSKKMIAVLSRQLRDGTWTVRRKLAWSRLEGVPDLSLEKVGDRWFMHNTPVPMPRKQ